MRFEPGEMIYDVRRGKSMLVLGPTRRAGHQYERYDQYEVYISKSGLGTLEWVDEFDLYKFRERFNFAEEELAHE